jgi:hypothetical protein
VCKAATIKSAVVTRASEEGFPSGKVRLGFCLNLRSTEAHSREPSSQRAELCYGMTITIFNFIAYFVSAPATAKTTNGLLFSVRQPPSGLISTTNS